MNILILSNKGVYPRDGGNLAILNLAEGYTNAGHNVVILTMVTNKHRNLNEDIEYYKKLNIEIIGVNVNTKISFIKLILNLLLSNKPYNLERFISNPFADQIVRLLNDCKFDFIQFEGLYTLPYLEIVKRNYQGKTVFRSHNIESKIWFENAQYTGSIVKKIYFKILAKRLHNFEKQNINKYNILLPISQIDATYYKQLNNNKPCFVTPFGVKSEFYNRPFNPIVNMKKPSPLLFLGSLDWIPNQEGVLWFIEKCFPMISNQIGEIQFIIAGRNAPKWLVQKFRKNNIQYLGTVHDAAEFFQQEGVFIVPLFAGSGMRVKIIEAMALGKAIVSTSKGIEGIQYSDKEILIADSPEKFADCIFQISKNIDLYNNLGTFAKERVKSDYDMNKVAQSAINFIIDN